MYTPTVEEVKDLDKILTGALAIAVPPGTNLESISESDRIGALILLRTIRNVAGDTIDQQLAIGMSIIYATIGASLGRMPMKGKSSVEMMNWLD